MDTAELCLKKSGRKIKGKGGITKKWYYNFMKRHPELTLRTVESVHGGHSKVTREKKRRLV
jgi:hypothetical protein